MTLEIEHGVTHLKDESQFTLYEWEPELAVTNPKEYDDPAYVMIHPWHRKYGDGSDDRSVAIVSGNQDFDSNYGIVIVDRDKFVEGLLAVFPELKRATD